MAKREIIVDLNRVPADKGFELLGKLDDTKNMDVKEMLPLLRLAVQPEYADSLSLLEAFAAIQQLGEQIEEATAGLSAGGKA